MHLCASICTQAPVYPGGSFCVCSSHLKKSAFVAQNPEWRVSQIQDEELGGEKVKVGGSSDPAAQKRRHTGWEGECRISLAQVLCSGPGGLGRSLGWCERPGSQGLQILSFGVRGTTDRRVFFQGQEFREGTVKLRTVKLKSSNGGWVLGWAPHCGGRSHRIPPAAVHKAPERRPVPTREARHGVHTWEAEVGGS